MNTKKLLMAGALSLSMVFSAGALTGCSNSSSTTTTETKTVKKKTIGKKTKNSEKLKVTNKTGKDVSVFETKSSSEENFSDNLLTDGDVFENKEVRTLYYVVQDEDTLSIKVGLKDEDTTYTFDKVDETENIKNVELKLNDDKKIELEITNKDKTTTKIEASSDEVKSDEEKENEEQADETVKTEDTSSKSDSKKDTTSTSSSTASKKDSSSSKSESAQITGSMNTSKTESKSDSSHTHNWVKQYKTVHHDAQYATKYVVDQQAYDEQQPNYTYESHMVCSACGMDFNANGMSQSDVTAHIKAHALAGETSGYHSSMVQVLSGYTTVHHDEVGHNERVLVKDAYDEQVANGYKCSTCGATKS